MHRRRFMLAAASAMAVPLSGIPGCGGGSSNDTPQPVPESDVVLRLPKDMYQHVGAPTEWWWHIGTLKAGSRTFGFEINAASFAKDGFAFSQIMLTDVEKQKHYYRTTPFVPPLMFDPATWAEADVSKNWYAKLGDADNYFSGIAVVTPGSGYTSDPIVAILGGGGIGAIAIPVRDAAGGIASIVVLSPGIGYTSVPTVAIVGGGGSGATAKAFHTYIAMNSPASDPTKNMTVKALLLDTTTATQVKFDLQFSQQGRPFFVWGTGVNPDGGGGTLQSSNYYFSLTRMQASGSIEIDGEKHAVSGVTWMDHEYGAFGSAANPVKWFLQDMQLDNGVCISNYATIDQGLPELNKTSASHATVQDGSGATWFVESTVTPIGRTWKSPETGITYFMQFRIDIPSFNTSLLVNTLVDSQEFLVGTGGVYEGVAAATGSFQYRPVTGTAWNEQAL